MKVIAYTALHYGRDYLAAAIRSVIDYIDEYHVLYTPAGSHSHRTDVPCPETRQELYMLAWAAAGDKLRWHDGEWSHEGQQRDTIYQIVPDADAIITLDADEIWPVTVIERTLMAARYAQSRVYRVPIIHYWRSFNRAILHDPAYPERLVIPGVKPGQHAYLDQGFINHMGYAQRSEIVGYKLLTHGHRNEFRRDCDWFRDVFLANRQSDCHPVGSEYWNPEPVNPLDYMPGWMAQHPYYGLELIP